MEVPPRITTWRDDTSLLFIYNQVEFFSSASVYSVQFQVHWMLLFGLLKSPGAWQRESPPRSMPCSGGPAPRTSLNTSQTSLGMENSTFWNQLCGKTLHIFSDLEYRMWQKGWDTLRAIEHKKLPMCSQSSIDWTMPQKRVFKHSFRNPGPTMYDT